MSNVGWNRRRGFHLSRGHDVFTIAEHCTVESSTGTESQALLATTFTLSAMMMTLKKKAITA